MTTSPRLHPYGDAAPAPTMAELRREVERAAADPNEPVVTARPPAQPDLLSTGGEP